MTYAYLLAIAAVIGGHFFFAYAQWFRWPKVCEKLLGLLEPEAERIAPLGRSFASYNASIAVGLCLSFLLPDPSRILVQGVVLTLITLTAVVGALGTRGNTILLGRLIPAVAALLAMVVA